MLLAVFYIISLFFFFKKYLAVLVRLETHVADHVVQLATREILPLLVALHAVAAVQVHRAQRIALARVKTSFRRKKIRKKDKKEKKKRRKEEEGEEEEDGEEEERRRKRRKMGKKK